MVQRTGFRVLAVVKNYIHLVSTSFQSFCAAGPQIRRRHAASSDLLRTVVGSTDRVLAGVQLGSEAQSYGTAFLLHVPVTPHHDFLKNRSETSILEDYTTM